MGCISMGGSIMPIKIGGFHIITNTTSNQMKQSWLQPKSKLWLKIQVTFCMGCICGSIMPIEFQIFHSIQINLKWYSNEAKLITTQMQAIIENSSLTSVWEHGVVVLRQLKFRFFVLYQIQSPMTFKWSKADYNANPNANAKAKNVYLQQSMHNLQTK